MKKVNSCELNCLIDDKDVLSFIGKLSKDTPCKRYDFNDKYYINVVEYDTKDGEPEVLELHKVYCDLHYLISGEEKIFFGGKEGSLVGDFDDITDGGLFKANIIESISYKAQEGILIYPNELHMAGYNTKNSLHIKKAIIKIKNN